MIPRELTINLRVAASMVALALSASTLIAHAGEDHSGESLATAASASITSPRSVPIETQLLMGIETARVKKETVSKAVRVLGRTTISPKHQAVVSAPQDGLLISTTDYSLPELGEAVKKDQILAIVEETIPATELVSLAIERARATSDLQQAEAELLLAEREYSRVTGLTGIVTDKDITALENTVEVAKAKIAGLASQVELLDEASTTGLLFQKRRVIRAPIDGVISEMNATLGENVGRDTPLFRIVDTRELFVEADVFENDVASVLSAQSASFTLEAYPGESFRARIVSIGTTVDERSRALPVIFSIPNEEGRLFAGMLGRVYIETGTEVVGLTIHTSAVVDVEGQQTVFVKSAAEEFTGVPVKVVERLSDRVVLGESGINEGDRVVVQGTYQVRMSKPVTLPENE